MRLDASEELRLREEANDSLYRLAVFEEDQGRNAGHSEALSRARIRVDVELRNLESLALFLGNLLEHRGDHFAGTAPLCPEIYQDGRTRLRHFLLKRRILNRNGLCHRFLPPCPTVSGAR